MVSNKVSEDVPKDVSKEVSKEVGVSQRKVLSKSNLHLILVCVKDPHKLKRKPH